jgi:hypothetical protein
MSRVCHLTVHYSNNQNAWQTFFFFGATAPIWALAYLHEILCFHFGFQDLRQSVGLLGQVISSSQGLYLYTNTDKRAHTHTNTKCPCPEWDSNARSRLPSERRPLGYRDRPDKHYFDKYINRGDPCPNDARKVAWLAKSSVRTRMSMLTALKCWRFGSYPSHSKWTEA